MRDDGSRQEGEVEGAPGMSSDCAILAGNGEHGHHLGVRTGKEVLGC